MFKIFSFWSSKITLLTTLFSQFFFSRKKLELFGKQMILFLYKPSLQFTIFAIIFRVQFYPMKKSYSNMAALNMNDRLHLEDVHQNSPASFLNCRDFFYKNKLSSKYDRIEQKSGVGPVKIEYLDESDSAVSRKFFIF